MTLESCPLTRRIKVKSEQWAWGVAEYLPSMGKGLGLSMGNKITPCLKEKGVRKSSWLTACTIQSEDACPRYKSGREYLPGCDHWCNRGMTVMGVTNWL